MPSPELHILLIGDTSRAEFHEAVAALEDLARLTRFASLEAAIAALSDPHQSADGLPAAHAIVLAQAYPGQFAVAAMDRLHGLAPLARLIAILGSWCEGESRSGRPLPGAVRIDWHEVPARICREFPLWSQADGCAWRLPATATDEERLLASLRAAAARRRAGRYLHAAARNGSPLRRCLPRGRLCDSLAASAPSDARAGAVAAIYDAASLDAAPAAELRRLAADVSPAPVLAVLDAPRIQDVSLARSLGAALLAKPFRVDELLWQLANLSPKVSSLATGKCFR